MTGLADLLQRTLGETITFKPYPARVSGRRLSTTSELENALVNLAVNARDAMPGGGKLTIEPPTHSSTPTTSQRTGAGAVGQYILIAVTDSGHRDVAGHLGEGVRAFFTTKPSARGPAWGSARSMASSARAEGTSASTAKSAPAPR